MRSGWRGSPLQSDLRYAQRRLSHLPSQNALRFFRRHMSFDNLKAGAGATFEARRRSSLRINSTLPFITPLNPGPALYARPTRKYGLKMSLAT